MKRVFFYCGFIFLFFLFVFLYNKPCISFINSSIHLSLYEDITPEDYIKSMRNIDKDKLEIIDEVNNKVTGVYTITYKYKNHHFILTVFIDDTSSPVVEILTKRILINTSIDPKTLIKSIKDDSRVTVRFKENYIFNEAKTYRVVIVVEDSYMNITEVSTYVLVEESDKEAPVVKNLNKLTVLMDDEVDLKKGILIEDEIDSYPSLIIDDSALNMHKIGEYMVSYIVEDASHNKAVYTRIVEVLSRYDNRPSINDGIKTCYLTFDDGPSSNTALILDILESYGIKATFFVTATSPKDFGYIKDAYQKGHVIGLHCFNHDYEYVYKSLNNYILDLNRIKEVVYKQIGVYPSILRFPGGSSNQISKKYNTGIMKRLVKKVIDLGYQYYDWSSINGDGENIESVEGLVQKAKEETMGKEDIMFLMHDSGNAHNSVKALPEILDYLIHEGYSFELIDEHAPTFHHTVKN